MAVLSLSTDIKTLIEYYAAIQIVGKPVKVRGVLEYHSDCPWCGGEDRFITRPEEGTYSCATRASGCGRFGDMISFLREYCDMSFRDACEEIGVDPSELGDYTPASPSAQVYGPPNKTWQERGERMVARAQAVLSHSVAGKDARDYLRARGFTDGTILEKGLGYIPLGPDGRWHSTSLEEWGLTAVGSGKSRLWQPEGILIPWYVGGKLWKLDVRRLNGLKKDDPKILSITGSVDCLYNHDAVEGGKTAVICESALCAIIGDQEAGDLAAFVATGGAAKNKASWVKHLEQATFTLISLDLDEPDENGKRPGDEGALYWENNLSYQVRWHPYEKDINDMLIAGKNIREWVQDGTDWYYTLLEAASEKVVIAPEPTTEEIPAVTELVIPKPVYEPMSEDDLIIDIPVCGTCLDLDKETSAAYEYDGSMYCIEHYPPLQGTNTFIMQAQEAIPALRGAKIEYWRKDDSVRMRESILRMLKVKEARTRAPYSPVSLPPLSRKICPCILLGWNKDGSQSKLPCRHKVTANGFCEEHQLGHELLQIGAQLGYPEVAIPFRWKAETLHRTIHAGIQCWEERAHILHADRPQARKEDVDYLRHQLAQEVLN